MQTSLSRPSSLRMLAIGFAVALAHLDVTPAAALQTRELDCGGKESYCNECKCCRGGATPSECAACLQGKPTCCELWPFGPCYPINLALALPISPLKISAQVGGLQLTVKRKVLGSGVVDVKLREALVGPKPQSTISIGAQMTGEDAGVGSLLFTVAFLTLGESALETLQAQGLDLDVARAPAQTCQAVLTATWCTALARQLAQTIYASLAVGNEDEREAFGQGITALGLGPCTRAP